MTTDNWLPPHTRTHLYRKLASRRRARWYWPVLASLWTALREIMLSPRADTGEWDSGARGL